MSDEITQSAPSTPETTEALDIAAKMLAGEPDATETESITDEPTPEEGAEKPPADPPLSKQFIALTKKRQAIAERENKVASREKALEARFAQFEQEKSTVIERLQELEQIRKLAQNEPRKLLSALKIDLEALNRDVLDDGSPEREVKRLREEFQRQQEDLRRREQEREQHAAQARIAEVERGFHRYVQENAAKFELAAKIDADELTTLGNSVAMEAQQNGLTFADMGEFYQYFADRVEAALEARLSRFGVKKPAKAGLTPPSRGSTLTNKRTTSPAPSRPNDEESDEERLNNALEIAKQLLDNR